MPAVADAAHAVVQEAMDAGVWVFGGGLKTRRRASWRPTERSRRRVPGGHRRTLCHRRALREEALEWAAKIAVACRCAQEVREFMPDPAVGN